MVKPAVLVDGLSKKFGLSLKAALKYGLIDSGRRLLGYYGNNPAHMGVAPVFATAMALERAGIRFDDLDLIELHEAFAATCLSIFKVGQEKYGQHWAARWKDGKLNPHGGSMPLGHPLAATGTRVVLNALYEMKAQPKIHYALATACAAASATATAATTSRPSGPTHRRPERTWRTRPRRQPPGSRFPPAGTRG